MAVAQLNNITSQNAYVDALTVEFPQGGRPGFAMNINNAAVYYVLAYCYPGDRAPTWQPDGTEKYITPSFATFRDVTHEGLPAGTTFGGIKFRSGALNTPASVTVM